MRVFVLLAIILVVVAILFDPSARNFVRGLWSRPAQQGQQDAGGSDLVRTTTVLPREIVLVEPVTVPAVVNGKVTGSVTLPRGFTAKLLDVSGTTVRIEHVNAAVTIPMKSTDLGRRIKIVPEATAAPAGR